MKAVILDAMAANPGDISWDPIEKLVDELVVYDVTAPEELIGRAKDAQICITNKTVFDRRVIDSLPDLKYIGVLATGYNVVDLQVCADKGIVVTNVPEYSTFATAQMTIALILELTNLVGLHDASVKNGDWVRAPQFCYWNRPLTELWNKTAVVIGYGKIGRRVAAVLSALGMDVVAVPHKMPSEDERNSSNIKFMSMEDAIPLGDIITFHCPLTSETLGLVNNAFIEKIKKGALLINAARGGLVVEEDAASALYDGRLGGYAADVVKTEPMDKDNPFLHTPNTVLTPHIAWAARETRIRLIEAAAKNLEGFLSGNRGGQINQVN